jgi:hypothetical protein
MKWLLDVLRVLDCRHRHLSRVFTIERRSYKVCFDCAREFDLPGAAAPMRSGMTVGARLGADSRLRARLSAP